MRVFFFHRGDVTEALLRRGHRPKIANPAQSLCPKRITGDRFCSKRVV